MFIKRQECEEQKKLPVDVGKCENVLNFLQQFPTAKMTYLEFLVKQKKLQVSFKLLINRCCTFGQAQMTDGVLTDQIFLQHNLTFQKGPIMI